MYPQTRVFDPSALLSGTVLLPTETPYLMFDASGADGFVNADDLVYSVEITVAKLLGTVRPITLECPAGWTTPAGLNTAFELPGVRLGLGAWRVLYDFKKKLIELLAASGAGFPGGAGIPTPQIFVGGAVFDVRTITGPLVEFNDTAGAVTFNDANLLTNDIAFTASKISAAGTNGAIAACPAGWSVNGALNTPFVFPGSTAAQRGAWLYYTNIAQLRIEVRPAL